MAYKVFANPNMMTIKDLDNEVTLEVTFHLARDDTKFATITVIDDEEGEAIAILDMTEDTLRSILEGGWHWGIAPPAEWNLDRSDEKVPPGTMIH